MSIKKIASMGALGLGIVAVAAFATSDEQAHRYVSEEWGFEVTFPTRLRVCQATSGGHLHGYYALLEGGSGGCDIQGGRPADRSMGLYASYNASFELSPDNELPCRNGETPEGISSALAGLNFPHLDSVRCGIRLQDGALQFVVAAQAGRWGEGWPPDEARAPRINYSASLTTRPTTAAADLAQFRHFLASTILRPTH